MATAIHAKRTIDLAAEMLGHSPARITMQLNVRRNEIVDPTSVDLLERVIARNQKSPRTRPPRPRQKACGDRAPLHRRGAD